MVYKYSRTSSPLSAQQKLDYCIAAGMQYSVGDRVQVCVCWISKVLAKSALCFIQLFVRVSPAGPTRGRWTELQLHHQGRSSQRELCDGFHRRAGHEVGHTHTGPDVCITSLIRVPFLFTSLGLIVVELSCRFKVTLNSKVQEQDN